MPEAQRVLAVANQKGGVGKTTTVVNLAAYLGAQGHRTLVVDCDPQANATRSITSAASDNGHLFDVLAEGLPAGEAVVRTSSPNLDLLPASPDLAGVEIDLHEVPRRENMLRSALESLGNTYQYVLLDCPPSLGLLTVNALVAARAVIVPVQCEYLALEGVSRVMDTIERVKARLNPDLSVFGLVMTMYDRRTSLSDEVAAEVRRHFPRQTFETVIPRSVRLSEAPSFSQPILQYDPRSAGAEAYASLAREVTSRG